MILVTEKDFNTIQKSIKLLEVISNQTTTTINHQNQPPRSFRHRCPHPNPQKY